MDKEDDENFKKSIKCWISDNVYLEDDVKVRDYCHDDVIVRDYCHITGKYRRSVHRDCNINVKLNHKISIIVHNLKNNDSHLIMQKLGKFNVKINVIPNRLKKYMSFNINHKLVFIDNFQFLSSLLDRLVKN